MHHRTTPLSTIGLDRARTLDLRRAMLGGATPVLLAGAAVLLSAGQTHAGATALSRHSTIRAASGTVGGPGGTGFDDNRSTDTLDRFADQIGWGDDPAAGAMAHAHQYSLPGFLGASGSGLEGAFAEGEVRSGITQGTGIALASSGFDVLFQVDGNPMSFTIGVSLGTVGTGTAVVELSPMLAGHAGESIFNAQADANNSSSRSVEQSGLLAAGQYMLRVEANSQGLPGAAPDNSAYFNFNLALSEFTGVGGTPAAAVPLPPAVLGGGSVLGLLAAGRFYRRRKAA